MSATLAGKAVAPAPAAVKGEFVQLDGQPFYRIANYDAMDPFFMSIVSASDHYLFLSSSGGLTCGRRNPDHALFPYYTDDRIHESAPHTGPKTLLRVQRGEETVLWEPFSARPAQSSAAAPRRSLYKNACGNRVVFEEVNPALELAFRYEWATSERFGFVRTARLTNLSAAPQSVTLLDGLQNLLPAGVTRRFQLEYSTLVDGYKRTELDDASGMAILQLTSVPVDRAEPSESLLANVAWSVGLEPAAHLLSSAELDAFRSGQPLVAEHEIHGRRGAYFVSAQLELAAAESREWMIVTDAGLDATAIRSLIAVIRSQADLAGAIAQDVAQGTENLLRIAASTDGLQATADTANVWHHFASSIFNAMRGGIPEDGYRIGRDDFALFVCQMNRRLAEQYDAFLRGLPPQLAHQDLLARARNTGDADLERIAHEYLPLTFSRRHGDPSRPWNIFDIHLKDERGNRILNYQGNWRDIFQNWEALASAYPDYAVSMIFKFLDCSTADGYNPYRIARDGCDWEVLEPHDSWSFIGYWGDHQVIYLLRLLEQAERFDPASLHALLDRQLFPYVNVPYRIKPYAALLANPQSTIVFDQPLHRRLLAKAARAGADGKLLTAPNGDLLRATMAEKLLLVLLTKLSNFVPGAGIWLNTQRPEWNDANNALVGSGASMVTVHYLRRYVEFVRNLLRAAAAQGITLPVEMAEWLHATAAALRQHVPTDNADVGDARRKQLLDQLGEAAGNYREQLYASELSGRRVEVAAGDVQGFLSDALRHLENSIHSNRREDGLHHAYNRLEFAADAVRVHRLPLMLEGQVSALSSGALSAAEAVAMLDALRASDLYRADQNSYILYPRRTLKSFLEKNNLAPQRAAQSKLLVKMIAANDRRIVVRDEAGGLHFHHAFTNSGHLRAALAAIHERGLRRLAVAETEAICAMYEEVFHHAFFGGRSEAMYKYEGIGCIYWHMVSKLLLAAREVLTQAVNEGAAAAHVPALRRHYRDIRAGLGTHRSPAAYGAVPTDPYSHTPDFAGAQQPGMTGQVKEDFLARLGEMGMAVREGRIHFDARLLTSDEFLAVPAEFEYFDLEGREQLLPLEAGTQAFTCCQVPVVLHRAGPPQVRVTLVGGEIKNFAGGALDQSTSREIFLRTGTVRRLDVCLGCEFNELENKE